VSDSPRVQHQGPTPRATPADTPARPGRGLPRATLEAIADERTRYPELSLRAFAMRLYDTGLYRAKGDKPADAGALARWLRQAAEEGLL
jgi:hypothetical protein